MTISFIIPSYQCKAVLDETVALILQANMPVAEILLIDDGSTDGTAELCDRLAQNEPLVRCIHKKNGGVSSARNLGIEAATGDYIWFVDSDDDIRPIPAAVLEDCEKSAPGMVLFGMEFDYYRDDRRLKTETMRMPTRLNLSAAQIGGYFSELFEKNYLSPVWNKLFRRSLLIEQEIRFDQALTNYEDLAFSLHVLAVCGSVCVLPDVYYIYKTDYDHDRTVDRIARIDHVAANTDLIADAFLAVLEGCGFDDGAKSQVKQTVLMTYLNLFNVKMQTTPFRGIRRQCEEFASDKYIIQWEKEIEALPPSAQQLYRQIQNRSAISIWCGNRYRKMRSKAARMIKPLLKRA